MPDREPGQVGKEAAISGFRHVPEGYLALVRSGRARYPLERIDAGASPGILF